LKFIEAKEMKALNEREEYISFDKELNRTSLIGGYFMKEGKWRRCKKASIEENIRKISERNK
jgi:hypothetical protein